jgi:2-polyprenyl-3-methyl-5-hydroxy-6-metoxy-1,4-benzoquinol methylase
MNIDQHLKAYGIRHFSDDSYWDWGGEILYRKIGDKGIDKLERLQSPLQSGNESLRDRQLFYEYISDARFSGVVHSLKAGAIKASGVKANSFTQNKKNILDFGCNIGYLTTWYALNNQTSNIYGFDISKRSVATAKQMAAKIGVRNTKFLSGDSADLPSNLFDLIIDTQSIFESEDKFRVLEGLFRNLDQEGMLVSIPQARNLEEFVSYSELIQLAGFSLQSIETLVFSDLGVNAGYGVFVATKKQLTKQQVDPEAAFRQLLELVKAA